ncbi:HdeD family acid-resistance protein [Micromonospora saelicesensis]|uniref:HdeD family acid-resistance protein n=1 Tax=Micromonospora TaxID=1873 RepID=UPI001ABFC73E|nr:MULTISPECIES: DUF308 domain-containing protein [Micromonospora]MBQ0906729.1 DUF308 domain-containing protein [Micromonospora sp. U21]
MAAIVFGLLALVWPTVTALALAVLFGAYALVGGALHLAAGFSRGQAGPVRGLFLLTGLLGIAIALVTLLWPEITAFALAVVIGIWAVVIGGLDLWIAVRWRASRLLAVVGVVSILAGLLILFRPDVGAVAIAQVIGIYAIVAGVLMLAAARQRHRLATGPARPTA